MDLSPTKKPENNLSDSDLARRQYIKFGALLSHLILEAEHHNASIYWQFAINSSDILLVEDGRIVFEGHILGAIGYLNQRFGTSYNVDWEE